MILLFTQINNYSRPPNAHNTHTHTHTHTKGPAQYLVPGTVGRGPAASLKGRHVDPEGDDTPGANAYTLGSAIGAEGAGVSMKGRYKDKDGNGQPGFFFFGICLLCV